MTDNTLTHYYQNTKTMTITHQESHYASTIYSKDTTDDVCFENNIKKIQSKCTKEYSSNTESKSFIQQRVERLYGPGALAQGFFVKKRQKNRDSESSENESFADTSLEKEKSPMKQSMSSPALPVLRHLRPEFRAQLPIISPRKNTENALPKSSTEPTLKEEVKLNGHSKQIANSEGNGIASSTIAEESGEKDGNYFLKILQNETTRLLKLADTIEKELENSDSIPEEIIGKIRSASGKARLLVSQKMQQFKGLCTNNITQGENEAFPTTNEDLQGFWDMVMLQVHQVDALFKEIEQLKANNWQEIKKEVVNKNGINGKTRKLVVKPKASAANEEARKKREAERRLILEERRKAMKAQKQQAKESIEIFVPESS